MDELTREQKDERLFQMLSWGPTPVVCWVSAGLFNSVQAAWARVKKLQSKGNEIKSLGKWQLNKAGRKMDVFYNGTVTIQNPIHEGWVGVKVSQIFGPEFFNYRILRDLRGKGWGSDRVIHDAWVPDMSLGIEADCGTSGLTAVKKKMALLGDRLVAWFTTSDERLNNMLTIASSNSWVGLLEGDTLINGEGQTVQINDFLHVIQTKHGVVTTPVNPVFDDVEEVPIEERRIMVAKTNGQQRVDPQLFAAQQAPQQQGPIQGELMPRQNTNLARVNKALEISQMRAQEALVIAAGVQGLLADLPASGERIMASLGEIAKDCAIEVEYWEEVILQED